MTAIAGRALERLRRAGIPLGPGLSEQQLRSAEHRFGIAFGPDHAALLRQATPRGPGWVDWLGNPEEVRQRLALPLEGVLFDVRENAFWPDRWGSRPASKPGALEKAREHLARVPVLLPVYGHRFLPAAPAGSGSPVFSVHQTDVIYYGADLADYIAREFLPPTGAPLTWPTARIDFWSDLAEAGPTTRSW
ncbi:hypothetical protein SAMN02982929_01872 [Saccharopolyspora kobensis]|uniref:SMI1/KNR4 family protein n=2 Tax=Saccharopolyspora kobensis TaxID=146035 RepID=A0A1H5ZLB6_9PSEU|nr:hypothetical protein [Saccharopolyspora kobensis]SEG37032.1 hypothetical protein SAMN02982929_01872 [Saccharopolyspora kobensis]SFF21003.1 hypothetical protein SAMN05216506_12229 [Saccharopolyspora kobensis]